MNSLDANSDAYARGPGPTLKALAAGVVCVTLLLVDARTLYLQPLRDGLGTALSPLVWTATVPAHVIGLLKHFRSRETILAENVRLQAQQLVLEARLQRYESLRAENTRLRELLSSSEMLGGQVLIAEVISINQDPYRQQIVIDKGERDGVYRGQALVDAYGILGQVVEVRHSTAMVLLVTDPQHGLPVEVTRTGLQTIAQGQGEGQTLRLPFLPGNADIRKGDLLVSSALGGRFPTDYPVAVVQEVQHRAGDHFKQAIAYPAAHINQGRQVLLVWQDRLADGTRAAEPEPAPPADTAPPP